MGVSSRETAGRVSGAPQQGALTREAAEAHRRWVRGGRQGTGRLDVVGGDASEQRLDALDIPGARLHRVNLWHATLEYSTCDEAVFVDCNLRGANVLAVRFRDATVIGCSFVNTHAMGADFLRAEVRECAFDGAQLDHSRWVQARCRDVSFAGARLGNSQFDRGVFRGCDFRGASWRPETMLPVATTAEAVFEDCDFRGAYLTGVDLSGATFRGCRFAGAYGIPAAAENLTLIDCELPGGALPANDGADALIEYLATRSNWPVTFTETGDARFPYQAVHEGTTFVRHAAPTAHARYETVDEGRTWRVRINEFPESASLYTLFIDGDPVEELTDWPTTWQRPTTNTRPASAARANTDDAHEQHTHDRELDHFETTKRIPPSDI